MGEETKNLTRIENIYVLFELYQIRSDVGSEDLFSSLV